MLGGHQQKYKRYIINNTISYSYVYWCDNEHINNFIPFFGCFYTIYIQEDKMELDMKKDIKSTDKISKGTLHEILLDIKYRLDHLEDIEADNRSLMVKLIKQSNSVVKFLAQIDIEAEEHMGLENMKLPDINKSAENLEKMNNIKELFDEFMDKKRDLKELEEELEKHKDDITPGQLGES